MARVGIHSHWLVTLHMRCVAVPVHTLPTMWTFANYQVVTKEVPFEVEKIEYREVQVPVDKYEENVVTEQIISAWPNAHVLQ